MMEFNARTYRLVFPEDRPYIYLESSEQKQLAELFILSSVNSLSGSDDTVSIHPWERIEENGVTVFSLKTKSSIWQQKTYRLRCDKDRFSYEIDVKGEGTLTDVDYFGGYYSGNVRWGSGFFWSGQSFRRGFNPEPSTHEKYHFPPESNAIIDLTGVPIPGKGDWFFTPPPFCFAMEVDEDWLALGVESTQGENYFTTYNYHGQPAAFYLSLSYEGHTKVAGKYSLPAIGFDFAADEYSALASHTSQLRKNNQAPILVSTDKPAWWRTPIFCGWGAQCHLASQAGERGPDFSRQVHYDMFLGTLENNDISPGIVVLDDKWQATYGDNQVDEEKWPDLPEFVAAQHAKNRKVLLWLKAWDPEGLPSELCITNAGGLPIALDPTNPDCEKRLRTSVRLMLSPDGYDADGFKIDFTARIPSGPGLHLFGDQWGLELMKSYLMILNSEAKKIKPDALIMTHTPHPYLADVVDMIRLNDINTGHPVNPAMVHRARVATSACPDAIIDTDNWPIPNKRAWHDYLQIQPELGVPSLYFATHIDSTGEALEADDYQLIRDVWTRWCKRNHGQVES